MAELKFDETRGVVVPDAQAVRDDLATKVQSAFRTRPEDPDLNVDPTSPMGQVVDAVAAEVMAKNTEVAFLAAQNSLKTAQGVWLDSLAKIYGLERKLSEPTVVTCICTGLKGTTIPFGAVVQDTGGNRFRCLSANGVDIGEDGRAEVAFSSIEHGAIDVAPGAVTKIVTVVAGWDTVRNPDAGAIGRSREPDGEFMNRITASYSINALGSLAAIQAKLAAVEGVLDCVVLENFTNAYETQYGIRVDPHSIAVCIVGGEDAAIAEAIYRSKDLGCGTTGTYEVSFVDTEHFNARYSYKIIRPGAEDFKVRVSFFESDMPDAERTKVKEAIMADFLGEGKNARVKMATTAYASRFYSVVASTTDIGLKRIEVALGDGAFADSVDIPANVEPSISAESIELVFTEAEAV